MAGFLSTLRKSCKKVFNSVKYTLSRLRNWFYHEAIPILQGITSTIHHIYRNYVHPFMRQIIRFIDKHPIEAAIIFLCIIIVICPNTISLPLLFILGYTVMGPAAGSLACLIQAMTGNVTAGSLFATFQSAGMLGYGLGILNFCVIASAVLVLALFVPTIMKTDQ